MVQEVVRQPSAFHPFMPLARGTNRPIADILPAPHNALPMTSIWLNRLSIAALIVACVLALWLFMTGAAISFFMSDRDPFPNAENDAFWLLFVEVLQIPQPAGLWPSLI